MRRYTDCNIPTVSLSSCEFKKDKKVLLMNSIVVGMPRELFIESNITGKVVRFVAVGPHGVLYDEDGWDGEQQVYRPMANGVNVDHLIIFNAH